ncbi:5-carboxymethyl-2-hydroxymuconate Delta-isomerase [Salinisphaera sp. USBA-960]|nr:5-carboxymethyl-2-hydroxymuconate Delta-isomerase [Salifodinibacter halophilus]NNC25807.1 5-carboxymethyl-2-hydroxymuconate Delta-isomerase [Salifodinibacter halophilus]
MPHLCMEYSANLEDRVDLGGLSGQLLETLLDTGFFEPGAVRVRALRCETYAIADRLSDNAFLDASLRIGVGRSESDCQQLGTALFDCFQQELAPLFETPYFALSFEIREISRELSWKNNAIHSRLRQT